MFFDGVLNDIRGEKNLRSLLELNESILKSINTCFFLLFGNMGVAGGLGDNKPQSKTAIQDEIQSRFDDGWG